MTSIHLDKVLADHAFAFVVVFSRLGPVLLQMPGFGEAYISRRVRIMFGMVVSVLLTEPLMPIIPHPPEGVPDLFKIIGIEVLIGCFFGAVTRLIMSALEVVGSIIAVQTGLSNATILNPALANQSVLPSALLSVVGVTLIFATGMDHFLLRSLFDTYGLFPPGHAPIIGDITKSYSQACSMSFRIGIQLAAPFLLIGLLLYTAVGVMQKLMPQIQLFLVVLPIQIYGGLFLMTLTVGTIMTIWLHYFDDTLRGLFGGVPLP